MVKTGQWHQTIKTVWRVKPPIPFGGSLKWLVAALLLTGCADSEQVVDESSQTGTGADFESQLQSQLISAKPGDVITIPAGRHTFKRGLSLAADGVTIRGEGMDNTILCLLYTSPSPRDRQKSRMPSSA